MTHDNEWDKEIRPEVKNVTRGRIPGVTFSTECRPISMSHERLCDIKLCFVVWPTTRILNNIMSGLQCRNVNDYYLRYKNAQTQS